MLQYFLNDISVRYTGNDLHVSATLLNFDADGRPLKTRFNLWAQVIE